MPLFLATAVFFPFFFVFPVADDLDTLLRRAAVDLVSGTRLFLVLANDGCRDATRGRPSLPDAESEFPAVFAFVLLLVFVFAFVAPDFKPPPTFFFAVAEPFFAPVRLPFLPCLRSVRLPERAKSTAASKSPSVSAGRLGRSCTRGRGVPFALLAAGRAASLAAGGAADAEVPLAESLAAGGGTLPSAVALGVSRGESGVSRSVVPLAVSLATGGGVLSSVVGSGVPRGASGVSPSVVPLTESLEADAVLI